jgi:hypothetical protein
MKTSIYKSVEEWRRADPKAYKTAIRLNYLEEICTTFGWDLPKKSKLRGYWTKERCIEEAKKYTKVTNWYKFSQSSYIAAQRNGWLNECTSHMIKIIKPSGYWTKERCFEEAKKYEKLSEWRKKSQGSYDKAQSNGWIADIKKIFKSI